MATESELESVPGDVVLGQFNVPIVLDDEAPFAEDAFGIFYPRVKRIAVDPRQSVTDLPVTVLHEVIHGLGHAYEITEWQRHKIDPDTGAITDKIEMMTFAILRFMRDNPDVVQWMIDSK